MLEPKLVNVLTVQRVCGRATGLRCSLKDTQMGNRGRAPRLCSPTLSSVQGRLKQVEVSPPAPEPSLTSRYPGVSLDALGSNGNLFVNWKENQKVDGV